jgi:phosphoglycerate dehydrogenase-like enzyme
MSDAIYVGPQRADALVDAVLSAGGKVADRPTDAAALVWYGGGPAEFPAIVHPGVRWVQLPNAGVEPWFEAGLIDGARVYSSAAGCYAHAVAEHTLGVLLGAARQFHRLARAHTWTRPAPTTLRGANVAVVGAGGIGAALIAMLEPLGAEILAVTRSGRQVRGARLSVGPDQLERVLRAADYVVLAAPTTPATRSLIGRPELAMMKRTAWLVNVGRGALVDTDALVEALRNEQIGGAALDVTQPEPLPDGHPLWSEPRAFITPHSANSESLLLPELARRVHDNTGRFLAGRPLVGLIDPTTGY